MKTAILLATLALAAAAPRDGGAPPVADPCRKPPSEKTLVKVNLKPDSEVVDVITWYAALTCTGVLMSNGVPLAGKKVTIVSPRPIPLAEVRRLFYAALDSVGLIAEPDGKFLRITVARPRR